MWRLFFPSVPDVAVACDSSGPESLCFIETVRGDTTPTTALLCALCRTDITLRLAEVHQNTFLAQLSLPRCQESESSTRDHLPWSVALCAPREDPRSLPLEYWKVPVTAQMNVTPFAFWFLSWPFSEIFGRAVSRRAGQAMPLCGVLSMC